MPLAFGADAVSDLNRVLVMSLRDPWGVTTTPSVSVKRASLRGSRLMRGSDAVYVGGETAGSCSFGRGAYALDLAGAA